MELKVIDDEPTDWVVIKPSLSTTKPVPILRAPNRAPPVTLSEVVVAAPALREPSEVPPLTVRPVVVALLTEMFNADSEPRDDPPETVKPVVVAFCSEIPTPIIEEVALTEKRVEVAPCPKISNMLV